MKRSLGSKATGLRLERMKASPRWKDGSFHNLAPVLPQLHTGVAMPKLSDFLCGGGRRMPVAPLPTLDPREAWATTAETGLRATWLGHSTVLVEIDGLRVLTDPVWGERASPTTLLGPKRFQPVPIAISKLPRIDVVLVSHDHYDHLDYATIRELAHRDVPFVTSLGVGAHFESWGVAVDRITELDWWESFTLPGERLKVTATPSQHFSGRSLGARNGTLWSSFAVHGQKHAFFFSGDTGLTTEYAEIRRRLAPFDLVMLEVGAFHAAWATFHLGPENALEAFAWLGGGSFLPVHWGTFNLAMHAWDEPPERLVELAPRRGVHLLMPRIGEPIEPARTEGVTPWWREVAALERDCASTPFADDEATMTVGEAIPWPID